MKRTTLTKSLHTVTAVSRLAFHCITRGAAAAPEPAVDMALTILGQAGPWGVDPTRLASIEATAQLVAPQPTKAGAECRPAKTVASATRSATSRTAEAAA